MTDIIKITTGEINAILEDEVMKVVQRVGISVDKDKLIKALQLAEKIVYCKECKWNKYGLCHSVEGLVDSEFGVVGGEDFCSRGCKESE